MTEQELVQWQAMLVDVERMRDINLQTWKGTLGELTDICSLTWRLYQETALQAFPKLVAEVTRLQALVLTALADRYPGQSEILAKRAEKRPTSSWRHPPLYGESEE